MDGKEMPKKNKNVNWNAAASECLLKFLVNQALNGNKPEKGFKNTSIAAAARHVNEKHQTNYTEANIHNHLRPIRRNWRTIQKIKFLSGNTFDHETNTIVMDPNVAATYIKSNPTEKKFINKPIKFYSEMEIICGNELATGASAKKLSHNSRPLGASRVSTHEPSSPILQTIGDEIGGEEVPVATLGFESAIHRAQSVTPNVHDGGSKKRKLSEEESFGQYFTEMKEVLQGLNTNRTVALAKDIKTAIVPIADQYPSLVLRNAQRFLVQHEVEGACFMSYSTSEKIEWMNDFMLDGMRSMSGAGGMNGAGGMSGTGNMSDSGGTSGMSDSVMGGTSGIDGAMFF